MSEHDSVPTIARQMEQVQRQMEELAGRLERIEQRLAIEAWDPAPAPPPLPTAEPTSASSPAPPLGARFAPTTAAEPPASSRPIPSGAASGKPAETEPTPRRSPAAQVPDTQHPTEGARVPPFRPVSVRQDGSEASTGPGRTTGEWERLIGGKWALWIGSVAVFLALAFFLAYTWHYLPPEGRLGVGFLAGMAFLGASGWFRSRVEPWFGEGLAGGGLAILYLSIWTGAERYGMVPFPIAFTLMAIVTASGVALAVHYNAVSLSALATLGGFLTPVVIHASDGGGGAPLPFLTYVALLNTGLLAVSLFQRWRGVIWLSFAATLLLVTGWVGRIDPLAHRGIVFTFVTLYFLLFLGTACFYSLIRHEPTDSRDLILLFADASVYAVAGYGLLQGALGDAPGTFPLALALFFALLAMATQSFAPANRILRDSAVGLALFFLTIAVPIQLQQGWVPIAWSLQAALLLTLGLQFQAHLLRRAGQLVWALSLFSLLGVLVGTEPTPRLLFLNARALPLVVSVLGTGWMAVRTGDRHATSQGAPVDELAGAYAAYAVLAGAWLLAQETYLGFSWRQAPSPETWQAGALFVIALVWAVYALGVFAAGLALRHLGLRFSAFVVAAMATALPAWAGSVLPAADWTPFWNLRWLSYVIVGAMLALLGRLMAGERDRLETADAQAFGAVPILVSILVLWGLSVELHASFRFWGLASAEQMRPATMLSIGPLWLVLALVYLQASLAWRHRGWRTLAYVVGAVGLCMILSGAVASAAIPWEPVVNLRFMAFCVATAAVGLAAQAVKQHEAEIDPMEAWTIGRIGLPAVVILLLWGVTQETFETFRYYRDLLGAHWDRAAQMGVSLVWSVGGALLLVGGIVRRHQPIRLMALALLGVTVLKVFFFDLGFLDTSYRILSFAGLGLALIGISWLYSRYGIGQVRA